MRSGFDPRPPTGYSRPARFALRRDNSGSLSPVPRKYGEYRNSPNSFNIRRMHDSMQREEVIRPSNVERNVENSMDLVHLPPSSIVPSVFARANPKDIAGESTVQFNPLADSTVRYSVNSSNPTDVVDTGREWTWSSNSAIPMPSCKCGKKMKLTFTRHEADIQNWICDGCAKIRNYDEKRYCHSTKCNFDLCTDCGEKQIAEANPIPAEVVDVHPANAGWPEAADGGIPTGNPPEHRKKSQMAKTIPLSGEKS